MPKNAGNKF